MSANIADAEESMVMQSDTGHIAQRFGVADDPMGKVFRAEAALTDVRSPGQPPRCEMLIYPTSTAGMPSNKNFWYAYTVWVDDWSGTNDEQLIGQWHENDPSHSLNPFMGLLVRGSTLSVQVRYNDSLEPLQSNTGHLTTATVPMPTRQWVTFVINAKVSSDAGQTPYLKVWMNGSLIVNYAGPIGYRLHEGYYAFPKGGVYHWVNGNAWDASKPTRTVMIGSMLMVRDTLRKYTNTAISSTVAN